MATVRGLDKHHSKNCPKGHPTKCDCQWRGRYKGQRVMLEAWQRKPLNAHSLKDADAVLTRVKAAIDAWKHGTGPVFSRTREHAPQGSDESLKVFIGEFKTHYAEARKLRGNSLNACLDVIAESDLGTMTLAELSDSPETIERWLNAEGQARHWKPKTWCSYHQHLFGLFKYACYLRRNGKPRMATNPMLVIARARGAKPTNKFRKVRITASIEQKLLAACDLLNRVTHKPNNSPLTMEKADAIRARVSAGETQVAVAKAFKVKPSTVNGIVKGETWNPAKYRVSTRGTEMKRRVIAALDTGPRAGELLLIQVKDVQWKHARKCIDRETGEPYNGYVITLPAENTKSGVEQALLVGTARLARILEQRRFQLKDEQAFIFGTEEGWRVHGLKRLWRDLFALAGLDYGRDKGMTWHTTPHEYISRVASTTKDPVLAQKLARHADIKTTMIYMKDDDELLWAAAQGLNR